MRPRSIEIWRSPRAELALAALGTAALCLVLAITFADYAPAEAASMEARATTIGDLREKTNDVRRRTAGALVWRSAEATESVRAGDAVYAGEGATAMVVLLDGTRVEVDERSMIVFRTPPARDRQARPDAPDTELDLVRGGARVRSGERPVGISASGVDLRFEQGSEGRVRVGDDRKTRIEVTEGGARIEGAKGGPVEIPAGQGREISAVGASVGPAIELDIELVSPPAGARRYFVDDTVRVDFRWSRARKGSGRYLLEVARDSGFADMVCHKRTRKAGATCRSMEPGIYYWRVRRGKLSTSGERTLVLVRDLPPLPFAPRADTDVVQPEDAPLVLAWTRVPDVRAYLVQLSLSERFESPIATRKTTNTVFDYREPLAEGRYCYRVRSSDTLRGASPWSEPRCFHLLREPRVESPELYDAVIEYGSDGRVKKGGQP